MGIDRDVYEAGGRGFPICLDLIPALLSGKGVTDQSAGGGQ